jgi:hypothetical protein
LKAGTERLSLQRLPTASSFLKARSGAGAPDADEEGAMRGPRLAIRVLFCLAVVMVASWGLGEEGGPASRGARPLGVTNAGADAQASLLTIHGHHLLPAEGELQVKLAGQLLEVVSATPLEIQALLPAALPPGTYLLEVLAGPDASWAAPVTVGEVADGAPPGPVQVSLLRVREAHADLVAGTLLLRGESLGTSPDTTPTVTLSDVPLTVLAADEVSVLAQLPVPLDAGAYRVRVVRTAPGGTASVWTDAMDVTTVAGAGQGDITAVTTPAGGGLQGGVTSGDASLGLLSCGLAQVLKSDGSTWSCAADADTDTGVNAVVNGGGIMGSITGRTLTLGSLATPANTAGAIVARDWTGGFLAGSVGLAGNLGLPNTTSASVGVLTVGGMRFLHNIGTANTFVGAAAGNLTLTGAFNSAVGFQSLLANTTGSYNSAFGNDALANNTAGNNNSAVGAGALQGNTTGGNNAAFGHQALFTNTTGPSNSGFGFHALYANTTGFFNSAFGSQALERNTIGYKNSAFGKVALQINTTGSENAAFGDGALYSNTTGNLNSAFGTDALVGNLTGGGNSAFGAAALHALSNGDNNAALGNSAGYNLMSGSNNVYISNVGVGSESNAIHVGNMDHTATYIAGISGQTSASGLAVYVASDGKLGTTTSSRRYKEQIADMDSESDVLLKLRPVSFHYRKELDESRLRQYGLVAEEVAEVAPDLVAYDEDGAPHAVRYHLVNAMLLNEVQKQRRRIEEQEAEILELRAAQSRMQDLEARLAKLEAAARNP